MMYGKLCTKFYDADKKFASVDEVNFYKKIFNKNDVLLEPMCGSGRLLVPLLQAGYTVHGVDNSSDMLKRCRNRALELGLEPILFQDEVKKMKLSQQYDGIIIPVGSFQLFYPRDSAFHVLDVFRRHLKPNGILIMDIFIPWDSLYENHENERHEREVKMNNGSSIKIDSHSTTNKYEQFILSKNIYSEVDNGHVVCQEEEQIYISWYYRYEMELILEKLGFKNINYQARLMNNDDYMTFIAVN